MIVHEAGHLWQAQHGDEVGHSDNPRSIMAEDVAQPWKGCVAAEARSQRRARVRARRSTVTRAS